ncbi:MAG: RagB/SusD family nutrient uptake outer membrane protein, partial [Sphingobacteriales bacterium]
MGFLTDIYSGVNVSFSQRRFGQTGMSAATDEAEGPVNTSPNTYLQFVSGSVNPSTVSGEIYSTAYTKIRAVNKLLQHLPEAPFSADQRSRVKGEAMFLRAWYYSLLLKHYGGVPIVGNILYGRNDEIITSRNSYAECVDYIATQCDSASRFLKVSYDQLNVGRATIGACAALKARVFLYAASPLFNRDPGNIVPDPFTGYADRKFVAYENYDIKRWKRAADAADTLIRSGIYQLLEFAPSAADSKGRAGLGFYRLFLYKYVTQNNEFIFRGSKPSAFNNEVNQDFDPPSRGGHNNLNGTYPYQELVDAFDMKDGKPATGNPLYNPAKPYDNRDPRFEYTILHNGYEKHSLQDGRIQVPVYTYVSAVSDGIYVGTATGYYIKKMISDSSAANNFTSQLSPTFYPLMRYAELLLNYAEAINEFDEGGGYVKAREKLIMIRKRAGIEPGSDGFYGITASNQAQMRLAIQHERRIELAFEEHRFWDVRRWLIADETENQSMNGMEIRLTGTNTFSYKKVFIRKHDFARKTYLWPFPQGEVSKA